MDTERYKQRLRDKERELMADMARFEGEARASGEPEVRDYGDAATSSESTSESLHQESMASQTLIEVQDALRRIEEGTYGRCTVCGRQIEPARLEAVPWTPYCLDDQELRDKAANIPEGGSTL